MKKRNYNIVDEIDLKEEDAVAETTRVEPRANFTKNTIIELYKSVGGLCSKCRRYTIARNPKTKKYLSIGEAAHIFGAKRSKESPRPNHKMSESELKGFDNGIWLCRNCHRQIDYDQEFFDSEKLIKMKNNAEQYVYELLNKDIQTIHPNDYLEFDVINLTTFQKCLIHLATYEECSINFCLDDGYEKFEDKLFNNNVYKRHIPFRKGGNKFTNKFDWDECWDIFIRLGFGKSSDSCYSIDTEKLWLLIYKHYSFLIKKPYIEMNIKTMIPDIMTLDKTSAHKLLNELDKSYNDDTYEISQSFLSMLEANIGSPQK